MKHRHLRKELGQHFLTRPEVCAPLIEFLAPARRLVVEIGPGAGALTTALLEADARVFAWEIDPRWAFEVQRRLCDADLTTVVGDATQIAWWRLPAMSLVAGNLPYNVSTRIVLDLLESTLDGAGGIARAGFMVQREVAERMAAGPGSGAYGSFSVLVAALADVVRLGDVPPGAFSPPPKVSSSLVGLVPKRSAVAAAGYASFKSLVRGAFALRRKTLRNSLASVLGREAATALVRTAGLESSTRAESLELEDFVELLGHMNELGEGAPSGGSGGVE